MKKISFLLLLISLCILPIYADNSCKKVFDEALKVFQTGQYYDAKLMFEDISNECGKNYKNIDAMLQLCNHKLKEIDVILYIDGSETSITRVLTQEGSSIAFDVECYGDYIIAELPGWCEILEKERGQFVVGYATNTSDSVRYDDIVVKGGGKTIAIQLQQDSLPIITEEIASDSIVIIEELDSIAALDTIVVNDTILLEDTIVEEVDDVVVVVPLSTDMTSINAPAAGTTEYIDVTCGKEWEVQYASGSMYLAERVGDYVRVKVLPNKTYSTRSDYFYIRTKDHMESIKITMYQLAATKPVETTPTTTPTTTPSTTPSTTPTTTSTNNIASISSTSATSTSTIATSDLPASDSSMSYTSTSSTHMSAYDRYCADQGSFEVTWFGTNFSIGTGFEYSISALRLRWGWFQLNPLDFSIGVDFLEMMGTSLIYSYQPSLNFVIPASENEAVYIGAGPVVGNYMWFKAEAGYRLHWGEYASSDIFVRYDGTITIGVSIQCSWHN